ncbi:MAG: ribosome recycling factor [SAR324 cluster bacterium]|uniref:Ribosome-recycling factor n=1 Tax=SAR324 cluster bacterium TaxID=2024889 RepID=A0A2A4SQN4_9DELT|nr:MAG: ribosome recycling factor [SAR324 cluster bacterium]
MEAILQETKKKMTGALEALKSDFHRVRTGRANPAMLEGVKVDYYGTPTALNQVGNISVPDPQLIVIAPWEKNLLKEIEKALLRADLGMTPQNDGNTIRLPFPPLTEDRRKDLVKQIKQLGEKAKLAIRNVRRDANDKLKQLEKEKEISEDDEKKGHTKVQQVTDDFIKQVDGLIKEKEQELMSI